MSISVCIPGMDKLSFMQTVFLGAKAPLELAHVKKIIKKRIEGHTFFDSICLLLWCQMTDLQCWLVYNSIFSHDVKYFQKFLGAKAPLGLVRVGK